MKNIFQHAVSEEIIQRIDQLTPDSQRQWGKMSVDQMLAHCNIPYAYTFLPENFKKPGGFTKFILRNFVKKIVVSETPYKKNGRTAPGFIINGSRDFNEEKIKLVENIRKAQELGQQYFDGKENISFGKMTATEWNNMFYKHLDHHLRQFGV